MCRDFLLALHTSLEVPGDAGLPDRQLPDTSTCNFLFQRLGDFHRHDGPGVRKLKDD